jgi:hypothetical protein
MPSQNHSGRDKENLLQSVLLLCAKHFGRGNDCVCLFCLFPLTSGCTAASINFKSLITDLRNHRIIFLNVHVEFRRC